MQTNVILPDALWQEISPIFTAFQKKTGRPARPPQLMLEGILTILITGGQWRMLPDKFGPFTTVHGTFMRWVRAGIFEKALQRILLVYSEHYPVEQFIVTDTSFSKAPLANFGGKNPTDRGKQGVKKAIIVDNRGTPLAATVAAANTADLKTIPELLRQLKSVLELVKRAPTENEWMLMAADGAYGSRGTQKICKENGVVLFAPMNEGPKPRKIRPSRRWIVEPTFGWLHSKFRGIKTCWCKLQIAFQSLLELAATVIVFQRLGVSG